MTKYRVMSWHVYLLRCADETLYCGITTDVARRVAQHNGALPGGASYTHGRGPVELLASAPCPDRSAAAKAEWRVKQLPKERKAQYVVGLSNGLSWE